MKEAVRIQVGASEDSVRPLLGEYRSVKLQPQPPLSIDDCPDKTECAYENARIPDYTYEFDLSPFEVLSPVRAQPGRFQQALSYLMYETPSSWRDPFSLRDSIAFVSIQIRAGRVQTVSGGLFVEGQTRWLGNTWHLSTEMPHRYMQPKTYVVDGSFLSFPGNGGAGTMQYLTPAAIPAQFEAAQSFNVHCLSSLIPCRCPSDLTPRVFEYVREHPEAGSLISNSDCPASIHPES
ncbi:MAG TPA: hypothetical protein VL346_03450 [Acidobacteriaceae bacterium]|jgi:hypothetical protein|nr:hypothetical protein [Acidobacteriaceae bacterium]